MPVTVRDLRVKTKEVVQRVRRGESSVVTHRGRPVARIIPFSQKTEDFRDIGFGMWANRKEMQDVQKWLDDQRKPRSLP